MSYAPPTLGSFMAKVTRLRAAAREDQAVHFTEADLAEIARHPAPLPDLLAESRSRKEQSGRPFHGQLNAVPERAWRHRDGDRDRDPVVFGAHQLHACGALTASTAGACWHCKKPIGND